MTTGTAIATQSASDVSFGQMERMASAVAKSGMFAVKTPEAALTLMMLAHAEGVHPAKAMLEYDLIQGKPALKAQSMLARFQQAGGKVEWLESTDAKVSGKFSHPAGGSVVVTWDTERVRVAGLDSRDMHRKFPLQMKRARCISEGVRAVFPGVMVAGLYTPEELHDMPQETEVVNRVEKAIEMASFVHGILSQEERAEMVKALRECDDLAMLTTVFADAWKRASAAKDDEAKAEFKLEYDQRKAALSVEVVS